MPHWFVKTMEGADPFNKINKVLSACIGASFDEGIGNELRIIVGTNKKIQPSIKQELSPLNAGEALKRLYNAYQNSGVTGTGSDHGAETYFYRHLYLFYAIVKKIDAEYNNILVLCATNLSILTALQEKHLNDDEDSRFHNILEFNKSIGNPTIELSDTEIKSVCKSLKRLQPFIEYAKEILFLQGFQPEDASEVCNSLRKLEQSGWNHYGKNNIASWLENTFLNKQIPDTHKNTKTLKL